MTPAVAADSGGGCLVADLGAVPAAFCLWTAETAFGRYVAPGNRRFGAISDLWVEPFARGRGIATALIRAAEAHLAAHGIRHVEITTLAANPRAQALYRRLGYGEDMVILSRRLT